MDDFDFSTYPFLIALVKARRSAAHHGLLLLSWRTFRTIKNISGTPTVSLN